MKVSGNLGEFPQQSFRESFLKNLEIHKERNKKEINAYIYYRHPCVATEPIMFCYGLLFFISFLKFTVRSQKLHRFSQNLQELCILV